MIFLISHLLHCSNRVSKSNPRLLPALLLRRTWGTYKSQGRSPRLLNMESRSHGEEKPERATSYCFHGTIIAEISSFYWIQKVRYFQFVFWTLLGRYAMRLWSREKNDGFYWVVGCINLSFWYSEGRHRTAYRQWYWQDYLLRLYLEMSCIKISKISFGISLWISAEHWHKLYRERPPI